MIVKNVDATYRIFKNGDYLVLDGVSEWKRSLCIVLYKKEIKALKTLLKRFK